MKHKKILIALLSAGLVAGVVFGAASSLGGLNGDTNLAADQTVMVSCDSDGVTVELGEYVSGSGLPGSAIAYRAHVLDLSNIDDDCLGKTATSSLTDDAGNQLALVSAVITDPTPAGPADDNIAQGPPDLGAFFFPMISDITGIQVLVS